MFVTCTHINEKIANHNGIYIMDHYIYVCMYVVISIQQITRSKIMFYHIASII